MSVPSDTSNQRREPSAGARWDVFVSYARRDAWRLRHLVAALREQGLRVFVDDSEVADFDSITGTISDQLAGSRVLVAFYSAHYLSRSACQWELTTAYLAGQREGDPLRRVLVVNPEPSPDHILPIELRDARHLRATAPARDMAVAIAARARRLATPIGAVEPPVPPRWLPAPARSGSPRFVGRLPELWRLHSALHPRRAALTAGTAGAGVVQVRGLGGIGKSLLAEEYALRFAAAFPGGIFWLSAAGRPSAALRRYGQQVRTVAVALGVPAGGRLDEVRSLLSVRLGEIGLPCLWVVDGVPDGLDARRWRLLLAPHPLAATLLTTRSRRYREAGGTVDLGPLPAADARLLLGAGRPAEPLLDLVGGHPQALDVAGLCWRELGATTTGDRLEAAARHLGTLPGGHPASLAATLGPDLAGCSAAALDVLRLLGDGPVGLDAAAGALAAADGTDPAAAPARLRRGVAELETASLLDVTDGEPRVPAVVTYLLRGGADPDPVRAALLRRLAGAVGGASLSGRESAAERIQVPDMTRPGVTEFERMAAFDIQVELAMRVGVQRLDEDTGLLREALSSLYKLFEFTRDTLRRYGPGVAGAGADGRRARQTLYELADELLNQVLRPFLTRWHPRLSAYEAIRPAGADPRAHEESWPDAASLRAELAELHDPLVDLTRRLSVLSGADLGIS
jgi:TIR domain-containing protein